MQDIRFATVADISTIQALTSEIWPATYSGILSTQQIDYMLDKMYSTEALEHQIMYEKHEFIILHGDGKPVAFASYGKQDTETWKLHKLYILPVMQGKGAGKTLMNFIVDRIEKLNARTLLVNVNRYNPARSFYEKLGFGIIAEEDIDIGGGYFMNDYIMAFELKGNNKGHLD